MLFFRTAFWLKQDTIPTCHLNGTPHASKSSPTNVVDQVVPLLLLGRPFSNSSNNPLQLCRSTLQLPRTPWHSLTLEEGPGGQEAKELQNIICSSNLLRGKTITLVEEEGEVEEIISIQGMTNQTDNIVGLKSIHIIGCSFFRNDRNSGVGGGGLGGGNNRQNNQSPPMRGGRMDKPDPGPPSRACLLYTSPSPRDRQKSRMPSSA